MATIVLSNDWAKYSSTDFWTINNVANKGSLKNGIDYTQTITVDTDAFPSNTRLSWSWPDTFNPMTFAYPEVVVGYKPWDNFGPTNYTSQINAIQDFKINYNLTLGGQTDNYNVAFTMWLTDEANGQRDDITHEVMVWVHDGNMNPAGTKVGFYDGPTFDADIWVNPSHGDTAGGSGVIWKYIALETTTDVLAGQIDMKALLLDLKAKGIITGTEYVNGYELGAEIAGRTGSLTINSLNQTFSTTTTPVTPPPSPPPPSTIVLSNDWAKYSSTDFWTINNVANKGSLQNGIDYTQTITVDTDTFPSNTTLSWSWPDTFNPMTFAYPEVALGYKPWDNYGSLDFTSQINDLREFKIDYNLTIGGQTDNFNVAFSLWLTDRAQGLREDITTEVMVWVHDGAMNPAGSPVGTYDGKTFDATVFAKPDHGGGGITWQYIALEASTDVLAGQIDIRHILFDLKQKGLLTGSEFVSGYELGAEVAGRTGSLQINSLGQTFSRYVVTAAADNLVGTVDDDYISALAGNDLLTGSAGNDSLDGGDGDDRLDGGTGTDDMRGGAGNDVYIVDNAGDIVNESVTGSSGTDTIQSSISLSLVNTSRLLGAVENLGLLGTGNISATGNALSNLITGNAGANVLNGSSGADNMRGLGGNDIYIVENAGDIVNESLTGSTGIDTVQSSISFSLSNATRVSGAVENLTLLGSAAIDGTGSALANTIVGNAAANVLTGAAGNDRLIGGAGNDTLLGSAGMDTVTGDLGNDIFRFVEAPVATDRDVITDFANVTGNNDTFQLENAVFTKLGAGAAHPLDPAFFRSNTTGLAQDADDYVIYNRSTGALYYDSNGKAAGGSVQIATLTNYAALTSADFTVI